MGSGGKHPNNLFRAMRSLLGIPAGAPEISFFEIPTTQGDHSAHPFLLPHDFFSAFYSGRTKTDWERYVTGTKNVCVEFWNSIKDTALVKHHPDLAEHTWRYTVPLGFHADAGAFSKQDSVYVFSFNSLVGRGATFQKRFIFTVIKKSMMLPSTMDAILRLFAWSCNTLLKGETPRLSYQGHELQSGGKPLAGPWRACLCQVRGDWSFYKERFDFPQWNSALEMCFCCRASSTLRHLAWSDFSLTAGWRKTLWTHESYLAHLAAKG